jgi:hypothetical protein
MKMEPAKSFEAEQLFVNLDKLSLRGLSYALRHPETWPKGFVWNYNNCDNCAMGLAHKLWHQVQFHPHPNVGSSLMAREFSIPFAQAKNIFFGSNAKRFMAVTVTSLVETSWFGFRKKYATAEVRRPISREMVTPEMVADDIDAYLAHQA